MGLTYDGTGRSVSLAEAMQDPGTPLAGTRAERAAAHSASAWIQDCNPSWYAGDGKMMKFENGQVTDRMGTALHGDPYETSGDGKVHHRELGL